MRFELHCQLYTTTLLLLLLFPPCPLPTHTHTHISSDGYLWGNVIRTLLSPPSLLLSIRLVQCHKWGNSCDNLIPTNSWEDYETKRRLQPLCRAGMMGDSYLGCRSRILKILNSRNSPFRPPTTYAPGPGKHGSLVPLTGRRRRRRIMWN